MLCSRVVCKLDIEKAYDHVNLDTLFYLLEMMGFGVDGGDGRRLMSLLFASQFWLMDPLLASLVALEV